MREDVKVIELNTSEQSFVVQSLVDRHNKDTQEGKPATLAGEIINDIYNAPTKKRKVKERGDAR